MKKTLAQMHYGEVFRNRSNHICMYLCHYDGYDVIYDFTFKRICEWYQIDFEYEILNAIVDMYDMEVQIIE